MRKLLALLSGFIVLGLAPSGAYAQATKSNSEIKVRLLERLDTSEIRVGRAFSATVEEPVRLDKKTVLAKGTTLKGTVTEVVSSGRLKRPASITLQLNAIGNTAILPEPLLIDGKSHAARNTALIGGGAAAGAILGAIAGGGKGAVIGTAVGAGAGTGTAYATGKQEIVLPPETELTFVIPGNAPVPGSASPAMPRSTASGNTYDSRGDQDAYDDSGRASGNDRHFSLDVSIGPPPPPRVVYVEPAPGPEFIWVVGYWYPEGRHYEWHEGYWTRPPYEGARWVPPQHDGNRFFEGYWQGPRGIVQHDHHWDRGRDRDFRERDRDREHDRGRDHDRDDHQRDD